MCKLYIETSDLDKAVDAVDDNRLFDAGAAILALKSDKLREFIITRQFGADFVSPENHAKFSIIAGIIIGLKLAEFNLNLAVKPLAIDDLVTAYDVA